MSPEKRRGAKSPGSTSGAKPGAKSGARPGAKSGAKSGATPATGISAGRTAPPAEDRFASVAANYDRWVGWEPRLKKEMPFLTARIPAGATVLDAGCGTGAHARALAAAGYRVTGADASPAMLVQAREAEARLAGARSAETRLADVPSAAAEDTKTPRIAAVEWVECDISNAAAIGGRRFDAVLALGNVLPAFGDADAVHRGLVALVTRTSPGGVLILQYLNGERIHARGRLVAKGSDDKTGDVWLRHHFEAGEKLWFHSYQLRHGESGWTAEVRAHEYNDVPAIEISALLEQLFERVELFDGLTGNPFDPLESDSLGVLATGRK
jgi:SAM-dependent methyltransferase